MSSLTLHNFESSSFPPLLKIKGESQNVSKSPPVITTEWIHFKSLLYCKQSIWKVNERKTVLASSVHAHTHRQPCRFPQASQFHNVLLGKPLETSFASNLSGGFQGGLTDLTILRKMNWELSCVQFAPALQRLHTPWSVEFLFFFLVVVGGCRFQTVAPTVEMWGNWLL